MFAKGIPDNLVKSPFPQIEDKVWKYTVQEHNADRAGRHFDIRLSDGGVAYSWATRKGFPLTGEKVLWVRQPDHTTEYMSFSGTITDGYGKGKVKIIDSGKIHILNTKPNRFTFNLYKGAGTQKFALIDTGGDNWICSNITPTKYNRPEVNIKKIKSKSINPKEININDSSQILTEKIDGAATLFVLKKDRPIEAFSYRKSKKGPELINRTYKYPDLYKAKVPKELNNTTIWGESYVTDSEGRSLPHSQGTGLLNANVWKARDEVDKRRLKFNNVIFNVDKYKGVDFSKKQYDEKVKVLEEIHKKLPQLKLPIMAYSPGEKKRLIEAIKSGMHPSTTEGFVIWDLKTDKPIKAKLKEDTELYVQGYEQGQGKYVGTLGKILATPDKAGLGPVTRVGGGFTDEMRNEIWANKNKYLKLPMKVEYQNRLSSGKLRMPIFKLFRVDW